MVSLVSLLGDILSLRGRDRIELASQVRPRLLQPSAKILGLLRVHEFLVCRGLVPGGSSTAISFTSAPESTTRGSCGHCIAIANGRALGDAANPSALVGHD